MLTHTVITLALLLFPQTAPPTPDEAFLVAVRAEAPRLVNTPDTRLLRTARLTCRILRTVPGPAGLLEAQDKLVARGYNDRQSLAILSKAPAAFCPDQTWDDSAGG
jgi:hypothetical protein